jgi:hypothetical protein
LGRIIYYIYTECIYIYIYRVYQEESAILWENVPLVNLYRYNQTYPYPTLNGYRDNDTRKKSDSFLRLNVLYLF